MSTQPVESKVGDSTVQRFRPSGTATRVSLIILATIASLWALHWAKAFFIPLAVAIFLAFWLMPLVNWLERRVRLPRMLGAGLVVAALLTTIGGTAYSLRDDARGFTNSVMISTQQVRKAFDQAMRNPDGWLHDLRATLADRPTPANKSAQVSSVPPVDLQSALVTSSTAAVASAANITIVVFLVYFLLASGDLFQRKLLVVISGQLARRRITVEILREIGAQFQRYLLVLTTTNLAIGLCTGIAFALLGVENAAMWGAAAALLHLVPYLGPAVIALASLFVTSVQFSSLGDAFVVASVSLLISALIGMLLTTWLASRVANMNSVATFAGLMFWGWLWGIPGLLLGTPLIMAINVLAERVECLHWLHTFLAGPPRRERKTRDATNGTAQSPAMTESAVSPELDFAPAEVAKESVALASTIEAEPSKSERNRELDPAIV